MSLTIEMNKNTYLSINSDLKDTIDKILHGYLLTKTELITLLQIPLPSLDAGYIMATANSLNHTIAQGTAEIHAQIGINLSPCPKNCLFCSFACSNHIFTNKNELSKKQIIESAQSAEKQGANAIYLMTTGDYPFHKFIDISKDVIQHLKSETVMISNIGDITLDQAKQLKETGYAGIYHAVRMGEGTDTHITPETRLTTIDNARKAQLLIGTCVEPIGPEHTNEEIAEKIVIARDVHPVFSGAMRRILIPGTKFAAYGMLTEYHLAYIVAIVRLAMGTKLLGNCTHEPNILGAVSGANLFWAETGTNPRDTKKETSTGRGQTIADCKQFFTQANLKIRKGPSQIYSYNNTLTSS
jgi:biotin synthase